MPHCQKAKLAGRKYSINQRFACDLLPAALNVYSSIKSENIIERTPTKRKRHLYNERRISITLKFNRYKKKHKNKVYRYRPSPVGKLRSAHRYVRTEISEETQKKSESTNEKMMQKSTESRTTPTTELIKNEFDHIKCEVTLQQHK